MTEVERERELERTVTGKEKEPGRMTDETTAVGDGGRDWGLLRRPLVGAVKDYRHVAVDQDPPVPSGKLTELAHLQC